MQTRTTGNLRQTVFDPDEPIDGFKKRTWVPPAEWGQGQIIGESTIRPRPRQQSRDLRFASGVDGPACISSLYGVAYEILYFEKVDKWVNRLTRHVHGYDTAPPRHQPDFNEDDLCAAPT